MENTTITASNIRRVWNPPNPYLTNEMEWIDAAPVVGLEVYEENAKSILSSNNSPDIGFDYSVNPYRGCFHACAYCYARPTHQYLGYGAGTDFERKITVKVNAPELLRTELKKKTWKRDTIIFSGITDCYQPLEASYRITRRCLEVCAEFHTPAGIITKGALVRRDIDVFQEMLKSARIRVNMSIAFADDDMSKLMEPSAPRPSTRFKAAEALAAAGIPLGVMVAPIIPGLNDDQIPEILQRAADAGATRAAKVLLRLPAEVKDTFYQNISLNFPNRLMRVTNQMKSMRGGRLYNSEFGKRHSGEGEKWKAIEFLFKNTCEKLGLNKKITSDDAVMERVYAGDQTSLKLDTMVGAKPPTREK